MRRDSPPAALIGAISLCAIGAGVSLALVSGTGGADAWSGPLVIAAAVLAISGGAKLVDPQEVTGALGAIGAPSSAGVVALIAAGEIAVGTFAVIAGGPFAAVLVAGAYLAFAAVAWRMSRSDEIAGCGCFGSAGARPGVLHVTTDLVVAALAAAAAISGSGGVVALVSDTPGAGIPAVAAVITGVGALIAVLTVAAEVLDAASGTRHASASFQLVDDPR
jgi:hypothetical protein